MMFVASRSLLFLLLFVDWAEDPQFGTCPFSDAMSSSLVDPLLTAVSTLGNNANNTFKTIGSKLGSASS